MNFTAIEDAIFNWVTTVLADYNPAVTVVWDEPEAPRPDAPSVRLSFLQGPTTIGLDEIRDLPSNPQGFKILGQRSLILSVIAYGNESFQIISDLQTSVSDPEKMEILYAVSISILSTSGLRDVTAPLETKFEKRAQMDFTMLGSEDKEITPGVVQHISLGYEVDQLEGSIIAENNGGD